MALKLNIKEYQIVIRALDMYAAECGNRAKQWQDEKTANPTEIQNAIVNGSMALRLARKIESNAV